MVLFLLSIIGRAMNRASVARSASNPPKGYKKTPQKHLETARWILDYTNQARKRHKLPSLGRYLALESAAQKHSIWMSKRGVCRHDGQGGTNPHQRMKAESFRGDLTAENCYKYPARRDRQKLAKNLVDGWMKSPGHRSNILHTELKYLGVGIADDGKNIYATQNFGG